VKWPVYASQKTFLSYHRRLVGRKVLNMNFRSQALLLCLAASLAVAADYVEFSRMALQSFYWNAEVNAVCGLGPLSYRRRLRCQSPNCVAASPQESSFAGAAGTSVPFTALMMES
jgi:hypothetical protein